MNPVNDVGTAANILNTYGPTITILGIFMVLFFLLVMFFLKMQEKVANKNIEEHKAILDHILEENKKLNSMNEAKHTKYEPHLIQEYSKINNMLRHNCMHFLKEIIANRVAIYIFHNGMYGITGIPFFKFSCIAEQVVKLQYAKIKDHHDIPINLMGDMIDILLNNFEYYKYQDKTNISEIDPIVDRMLISKDSDFIIRSIIDSNKNIIGFILAEFDTNDMTTGQVDFQYNHNIILTMARAVAPILEISEYGKKIKKGDEE